MRVSGRFPSFLQRDGCVRWISPVSAVSSPRLLCEFLSYHFGTALYRPFGPRLPGAPSSGVSLPASFHRVHALYTGYSADIASDVSSRWPFVHPAVGAFDCETCASADVHFRVEYDSQNPPHPFSLSYPRIGPAHQSLPSFVSGGGSLYITPLVGADSKERQCLLSPKEAHEPRPE